VTLTRKQQAFIEEYLLDFNATRAAERAGYKGSDNTLAVTGHDLLKNPKIEAVVHQRLQEKAMRADEVLMRLADQARASIADFLSKQSDESPLVVDLDKAARLDKLHLVKKLKHRSFHHLNDDGDVERIEVLAEIELHDPQKALELLGKHHGLFRERVQHSGELELTVDDPRDELLRRIHRLAARTDDSDGDPGDDSG
jgi:phage terminase small subunit